MQATRHTSEAEEAESDTSFLPDPLINPGEYEPLLEKHTAAEHTEDKEPVNEEPRRLMPLYTFGSDK